MGKLPVMELSEKAVDFIDDAKLEALLAAPAPSKQEIRDIMAKSMAKQPLTAAETSRLLLAEAPDLQEEIFEGASKLKKLVYGNRIVLFAPLYIGNKCINNCRYCGFRSANKEAIRRTLTEAELTQQIEALENKGHKRLIIVFGEHPDYDADYIAKCVRQIYGIKRGKGGEIRRLNVNAAPLDHEGYRKVKEAGIGTYQIFHETYHHKTYAAMHPAGTRKADYLYRLDGLSRALEAGCDDVGLGALIGLADWRFEVLGLVSHALHLQARYGVGPHTISFPRIRPASGLPEEMLHTVNDSQFKRLVAILRMAVPYTGLILTARETPELRRAVIPFGISQIDAGSRVEIGGYTEFGDAQVVEREQFVLGDIRPLDTVMRELMEDGSVPSFCTACYRLGRTGEHFMEFAIPGFIKKFCTPNSLTTLEEYLVDYATPETRKAGEAIIKSEMEKITDDKLRTELADRLRRISTNGEHDLYF